MPIVNNVQLNMHVDWLCFNSSPPRQNDHHFTDYIFRCIFGNETYCILIKIPLKFVPKGPIYNIPALVQIMAWRRPGDKPLSEPMMVSLQTHICVTWPQWVNCFIVVVFLILLDSHGAFSHIFQDYLQTPLQWRHNECNGISNHRRFDCLLSRFFRCRSKKTSKLCITGLCDGNPPVASGFPSQRASNAINVSIRWCHHDMSNHLSPVSQLWKMYQHDESSTSV